MSFLNKSKIWKKIICQMLLLFRYLKARQHLKYIKKFYKMFLFQSFVCCLWCTGNNAADSTSNFLNNEKIDKFIATKELHGACQSSYGHVTNIKVTSFNSKVISLSKIKNSVSFPEKNRNVITFNNRSIDRTNLIGLENSNEKNDLDDLLKILSNEITEASTFLNLINEEYSPNKISHQRNSFTLYIDKNKYEIKKSMLFALRAKLSYCKKEFLHTTLILKKSILKYRDSFKYMVIYENTIQFLEHVVRIVTLDKCVFTIGKYFEYEFKLYFYYIEKCKMIEKCIPTVLIINHFTNCVSKENLLISVKKISSWAKYIH